MRQYTLCDIHGDSRIVSGATDELSIPLLPYPCSTDVAIWLSMVIVQLEFGPLPNGKVSHWVFMTFDPGYRRSEIHFRRRWCGDCG